MTNMHDRSGRLDQQEEALSAFVNHAEVETCYRSCERDNLEWALTAKAEELIQRGELPRIFSPKEYADYFISGL